MKGRLLKSYPTAEELVEELKKEDDERLDLICALKEANKEKDEFIAKLAADLTEKEKEYNALLEYNQHLINVITSSGIQVPSKN